jgi:hypothetical protein
VVPDLEDCRRLTLLPTIVALRRHVPHVGSIAVINIFLGWTIIG